MAWLDLQGNKLHGQLWIGGVWTGATQLTRDEGTNAVPGVYAYSGSAWEGELRLYALLDEKSRQRGPSDTRFGTGEDRPVIEPTWKFPDADKPKGDDDKRMRLSGLAVHNGLLVASLPTLNQLLFVDAKGRKVLGTAPLADPRGLGFDRQGRLLALTRNKLVRFSLDQSDKAKLPSGETVIGEELDDAQQLAFDADGTIFVSDHGNAHQVKVFSADGKLVRRIGVARANGWRIIMPRAQSYSFLNRSLPGATNLRRADKWWSAALSAKEEAEWRGSISRGTSCTGSSGSAVSGREQHN